jgi:hypothetical protein
MSLGLTVLAATVGVWLVLHYALESDVASRTPRPDVVAEIDPPAANIQELPPLAATIVPVISSIAPTTEPERLPWLPTPAPTSVPRPTVGAVAAKPPTKPGTPLVLQASVAPAAPISENALVTVSLALSNAGDPVEGAVCYANAHFRTLTARLPENGAVTGAAGRASFTIDARGATYDRHVPVEVTCRSRAGTASATTGFTPRRG